MTAVEVVSAERPRKYAPGWGSCSTCEGSGYHMIGEPLREVDCVTCRGSGTLPLNHEKCGQRTPGAAYHVSQHSSESNEHYTPVGIVKAARIVLGGIDLDPASCPMAQEVVKAVAWYGPGSPFGEDGLAEPGAGRVFLNPPGGLVPEAYAHMGTRSNAALWWAVWSSMWLEGEIDSMIFVGFTLEILRSAQSLDVPQPLDFPLCVPSSRIKFDTINTVRTKGKRRGELIDPNKLEGDSPTHANVIVYLPPVNPDWRKQGVRHLDSTGREGNVWFEHIFKDIGRYRT